MHDHGAIQRMSLLPRSIVRIAACTALSPQFTVWAPFTNSLEQTMHRYVIERNIPGVGTFDVRQLQQAAATSNAALAQLAGKVQWVESYVVDDKTFCIYLAENEAAVHEHSRISGFPASKVTAVRTVIDPMTEAA
jgi:hypothetical protein